MEQLKNLINRYKKCKDCLKTTNYPKEWLEEIVIRQKEVFSLKLSKDERVKEINKIREEYSKKFDNEIREVKIPFNGNFLTLNEAESLIRDSNEQPLEINGSTFKKNRKMISYYKEYLNSTDWYVTRKQEIGKEIPKEILDKRAEFREKISNLKNT